MNDKKLNEILLSEKTNFIISKLVLFIEFPSFLSFISKFLLKITIKIKI